MNWIYLSPHFDDAVLSCGGLIWEQANLGNQIEIWTICAGEPPDGPLSSFANKLHARWQIGLDAIQVRKEEDMVACHILGAQPKYFMIPDCIYRKTPGDNSSHLYNSEESIFGTLAEEEQYLIKKMAARLLSLVPENSQIVSPLAVGNHVDHQFVRQVAENLKFHLWYYPDYPYILEAPLSNKIDQSWQKYVFPVSGVGILAWQAAVGAYTSQLSTFWPDLVAMQTAIRGYSDQQGGVQLWQPSREDYG